MNFMRVYANQFSAEVMRRTQTCVRGLKTSRQPLCKEITQHEGKTSSSTINPQGLTDHRVNRFEKYLLVWSGHYKKVSEVPNLINQSVLEKSRNKARVKINLIMVALTAIGCIFMIMSGKRAAARGDSVAKMNEEFHRKYNEEQTAK